ncbi:MAG TPA: bifunctional glutamate N-acetyltransferase/amino-acid acetyltransferase ArgJ [Marinagarivorans sp.]
MAVGQQQWPVMHPIAGLTLGTASAGIKYPGRTDIVVMGIAEGATVAGVFTQNAFCAAPVIVGRNHLASGDIRYFVINSGNANACTGERGLNDAEATCRAIADLTDIEARQVIPFSTGVIGEYLPVDKIAAAVPAALESLSLDGWAAAAKAIMTTDTRPKGASVQFEHDGEVISVTGIAKGAGMIRPNMATMLAYIATDAVVAQSLLDDIVKRAADKSFNRISIDGDTSTNDSCLLVATGQAGLPMLTDSSGELYEKLLTAVTEVHQQLALAIVRDGEGATKCISVDVQQGGNKEECLKVAYAIAHSPLIKTALFASDPNWGRIICAVGYAGIRALDTQKVNVFLDDVCIVRAGQRAQEYTEEQGQKVVDKAEFTVRVELGRGHSHDTVWTTDLSHDYVTINAEYRS